MKVYGLVGKSGTGKSYQAMNLCKAMNIASIIDDGLFIYGSSIMEGISAKRQSSKIAAIKTALFTDEEHRLAVADKIKEMKPNSILILGTSEKMIYRIAERIDIASPERLIHIEDITTAEERETARMQRHELGKHIIPVPTFQLKREFSGYFLDPLRMIRKRKGGKTSVSEKTVVRPTYSYMGEYSISDKVIVDVVYHLGETTTGIDSVSRVTIDNSADGIGIHIAVICCFGYRIMDIARELQHRIAESVETMTAFHIKFVDIDIKGLR